MTTKKIPRKYELLLLLQKKGNGTYHLNELRNFVGLKSARFFVILNELKREGFLSMKPCLSDNRMRSFTLKENAMARLKKRNVIPFDRKAMVEGIKRRHNLSHQKPKKEFILIPDSIMGIINHWNSQPCVKRIKVPEITFVGNMYANPTKTLSEITTMLRKAVVGRNFLPTPLEGISDRIRPTTVEEIKTAIDRYTLAVTSTIHEPRDKKYFKYKMTFIQFLHNPYSFSRKLMFRSPYLYFIENEPELLVEQAYLQKLKKEGIEREWLELITDVLAEKFTTHFDFERTAIIEAISVILYDFAEDHGGIYLPLHGLETWPYWLIEALKWKKENSKRLFVFNPLTLLQPWIYEDVLISYIKYIQADHTITFPKNKRGKYLDK